MMKGLSKYVDGEHYFDTLANDVVFEFLYEFPGWPRETRGRENLIALYSGYGRNIRLDRGDSLLVHPSDTGRVVTLEYEVHGRILANNAAYHNSPLSVDSLHFVRRIWWPIGRLGAMIAERIRLVPIGGYGEHPQPAGTVRADVNRRIIQNCPHS